MEERAPNGGIYSRLSYQPANTDEAISVFVERIWALHNTSNDEKEITILPDGRILLFFSKRETASFSIMLVGLDTKAKQIVVPANSVDFVVGFKPLAMEYIFQRAFAGLVNGIQYLPNDFGEFK